METKNKSPQTRLKHKPTNPEPSSILAESIKQPKLLSKNTLIDEFRNKHAHALMAIYERRALSLKICDFQRIMIENLKSHLAEGAFMKYSFKIASAWGIPIELHITFILLMAAVLILTYPQLYFFTLILFLFVFVVVHELAHSMVARHYNIKVRKIVLYPIGGVSEIEEIPENPGIEWRVAIAGPLASFVVGGLLLALGLAVSVGTPHAPTIVTTGSLMYDLGTLNVLLGAFNLIPAFPMDGGRVFRALLAERLKFSDATKYAAFLGRLLGIFMAVFGIFYNLWLIIIGLFIYVGASEETEQTIVSTTMARVRVKDVMSPEVMAVEPETTLDEALEIMFKARYHDIMIQKEGIYQGVVTWDEINKVEPTLRAQKHVSELPAKKISIFPDESILEAYKLMTREKVDLIPVVYREDPNKVAGVVTSEAVAQAYEKAKSLR